MKKNRKIYDFTFVLPGFTPIPPGGYMVVFELSKYLVEKGNTVLIVFLRNMNKNLYNFKKDRKILDKIRMNSFKFRVYDYFQNTVLIKFLIYVIKKRPPYLDIIGIKLSAGLAHGNKVTFFNDFNFDNIDFSVRKEIPKKLKTIRTIATAWETSYFVDRFKGCERKYYLVQNDEDNPSFSGQLSTLAHNSYDLDLKKIVINKQMQERFSAENPIKITVAAHIIGNVFTKPEDRNNKIILMQMREGADKGATYAVEAARLIKTKRQDVEIVSFGNYKQDLPAFITHLGYVSNTKYIELFNRASLFVLPSLVEGFSTPVLEAMSCGCVPIATKCGGPENFVDHKINGLLVPIKSAQDIADSVIWLLENKEKRIEMAYQAIDTSRNFSLDRMGNEFICGVRKYEETNKPIPQNL